MSKFFHTPLWQSIKTSWVDIVRTYWVPALASVVTTVFGIIMSTTQGRSAPWIGYAFLTGILATIIFGGIALLDQDRTQTPLRTAGRYALGSIPLLYFIFIAQYYSFPSAGTGITFALLTAGSVFFLLCSAELRRDSTSTTMWQFGLRSVSISIIATAVGVIGQIAASLAALSIEHLFQVRMPEEVYLSIAIIMFAFVTPILVIASISHVRTVSRDPASGFSPMLLRLVQIVFTPILIAYFLILYAYLLKIVFQWELPQESVVLPVLVYTIVGVCTYALVDPWRRANAHPAFNKLQLSVLFSFFPLLVLYGFAIGDRIREYGMTEPRYLSALFGMWLFVMSIAFLLRRNLSLRAIPLTLSLLFFIAALPGIGAVSTTVRSQQEELIVLLQQEKILVDGKLAPAQSLSIPPETGIRLSDILYTLKDREGIQPLATTVGLPETSSEDTVFDAIQAPMGWGRGTSPIGSSDAVQEYAGYIGSIQVAGYDELFEITSWPSPTFFSSTTIRFSGDGMMLFVESENKETVRVSLAQFPSTDHPTYDAENKDMRVRVIPVIVVAEKKEDGSVTAFRHLQLRVLVDFKSQP